MQDLADLAGFELCSFLGRPVAVDECKGFSFGAPPDGMAGAVLQRKNKLSNLDEKIEKARETGDPLTRDMCVILAVLLLGHFFYIQGTRILMSF